MLVGEVGKSSSLPKDKAENKKDDRKIKKRGRKRKVKGNYPQRKDFITHHAFVEVLNYNVRLRK